MPCTTEEECRRCIISGNCAAAGVTRSEAFWELFGKKLVSAKFREEIESFVFGLLDEKGAEGNGKAVT